MLSDKIGKNIPAVITMLLVITVLFWIKPILSNNLYQIFNYTLQPIVDSVTPTTISKYLTGALCVFSTGLLLYYTNRKNYFVTSQEQLLPSTYIVCAAAFGYMHTLSVIHVASIFTILALERIFRVYRTEYAFSDIFISGFYVGIATMFYAPAIILIIPLFLGILGLKYFNNTDSMILLSGVICPYYFSVFYCYFYKNDWKYLLYETIKDLAIQIPEIPVFNIYQWVFIALVSILTVWGIIRSRNHSISASQKTLTINSILKNTLFVYILGILFLKQGVYIFALSAIPASVFMVYALQSIKRKVVFTAIIVLIISSAYSALYFI